MDKEPETQVNSFQCGQALPPIQYQVQTVSYVVYTVDAKPAPVTNVTVPVVRTRPNNYLVQSVLVTLFCCLPFGIIGVAYGIESNIKFDKGNDVGAASSAIMAKFWSSAGLVCGIILFVTLSVLAVT